MTTFQSVLRWIALGCLIGISSSSTAQTFELSLEEGRIAARRATLAGSFVLARDIALALTQANPNDRQALIVLAAVQPQLGEPRQGRSAGVRAFRLSDTEEERYEAARLVALAAANEERYTLSQFWLRRAAINAPDERAYQQTQSDYRGIRRLNPVAVNLGFSIVPSSNVNGGSEAAYNIIDGSPYIGVLSGDAQALSGIAATADLRLAYTVSADTDHRTALSARAYARSVWLSQDARETAPSSRNSDFGSQVLEFGLSHQLRLEDGLLSMEALAGANWFGGDLSSDYIRGSLGYGVALSDRTRLTLSGEVQRNTLHGTNPRTNLRSKLTSGLTFTTNDGDRLSGWLSFESQSAANLNERYESLTIQTSYSWADPIGPVQLSVSAGASFSDYRDYSVFVPVPGGRQDRRVFGNLQATFPDIEYAGFVPVVTLGVQDTQSNVSRFERNEYSLGIGVRSSF